MPASEAHLPWLILANDAILPARHRFIRRRRKAEPPAQAITLVRGQEVGHASPASIRAAKLALVAIRVAILLIRMNTWIDEYKPPACIEAL